MAAAFHDHGRREVHWLKVRYKKHTGTAHRRITLTNTMTSQTAATHDPGAQAGLRISVP
jgi:hypothetical protein